MNIYIINNKMSIGLPVKLLHESQNHVITIEVKTGELYRGYLTEAEVSHIKLILMNQDSMNVRMDNVTVTMKDGKVTVLEQVILYYIRFI